ncbi:MAG: hypothetical protein FWH48_08090 [Oscillospiraceae bacterium]|nr:hypothetical protein [Oscillospiraceae bacterium]
MPTEYDLIKSERERDMPEEQYQEIRAQYEQKSSELSARTKKLTFTFLGAYAASFALLYARLLLTNNTGYLGSCSVLLVGILLCIFLYDPKVEEDKKPRYETDKGILLKAAKSKITAGKIRLGLVIGLGSLFSILNIVWWVIFWSIEPIESITSSLLTIFWPYF